MSLEDKATAVIQDCMMREEKRMVSELAGQKGAGQNAYLYHAINTFYYANYVNNDIVSLSSRNGKEQ